MSDNMCDTAENTDANGRKICFRFHECHARQAKGRTGKTVDDAEHISEQKTNDQNADNRHDGCFAKGITLQQKEDRQIRQPQFDAGKSNKYGKQRFHIAENDSDCGK